MLDIKPKLKEVLLVEDDSVDAMAVRRAMDELNVKNKLVHFATGEKALEYLKKDDHGSSTCVILLDLNMPGMNGIEFLKNVKSDDKLKNIPVVMLAASREEENIVETFNLGVAGYIFKPVDCQKLMEFEPMKFYLTVGRRTKAEEETFNRRTLICFLLLIQLIVTNTSYNLWAENDTTSIQEFLTANVIYDLWTKKVTATKTGTVVGILYNEKGPSALINHQLVYQGDVIKGVKILKIDRDKVKFEKNGRKWTQKMLDNPSSNWEKTK